MNTILSAAQINRLAQRLSDKPLGRSASATTAAERLQRLLAVRIGVERAAASAKAILGAPGFETAEGRLVAESSATRTRRTSVRWRSRQKPPNRRRFRRSRPKRPGNRNLPRSRGAGRMRTSRPAPGKGNCRRRRIFSAATHARFRAKLEGLVALAEKGDVAVCAPSRSTRFRPARRRWRAIAILASSRSRRGRAGREDHPHLRAGRSLSL